MKIIELKAENFKRLKAVEIKPTEDDSLVLVTGRNEQGKSSVLDAIWSALDGKAIPQKPIRDGENKAEVVVNLGDYIVKRSFTKKGNRLIVTNADGKKKFKSPQTLINKFIGDLSFDPFEFIRLDSKKQSEILRKLVKLELVSDEMKVFDEKERAKFESPTPPDPFLMLNLEYRKTYDERTLVNRELKNLTAQLQSMPDVPETPRIDIMEIMKEKEILEDRAFRIQEWEIRKTGKEANLNGAKELYARLLENPGIEVKDEEIIELEKQIKKLQQKLMSLKQQKMDYQQRQREILNAKNKYTTVKKEYEHILSCEPPPVDLSYLSNLQSSIEKAIEQNKIAEQYERKLDVFNRAKKKKEISDALTDKLETINNIKRNIIKRAKMPIEGLSFDEEGVTYKGIPISQCSSAEALKVACAVGMSLNPELKVILIRDGSLIDSDNMKILREMASRYEFQLWIEKVDESGEIGFYIEDGALIASSKVMK